MPEWLLPALAIAGVAWFAFGPDAVEYVKSLLQAWKPDVDGGDLVPQVIDERLEYLQLILELRDIFSDDEETQDLLDKLQLKVARVADDI